MWSIISWIGIGYLAYIITILYRRLSGETADAVYKDEDLWGYILLGPIAFIFAIVGMICHLPWKNVAIALVETIVAIKNKKSEDE